MTGPHDPWTDQRLHAAFTARASKVSPPVGLGEATITGLRDIPPRRTFWRQLLPAVAVVTLAVAGLAVGLLTSGDRGSGLFRPGPLPDLRTFDNGDFTFDFPAGWHAYDASAAASGSAPIAVLGTKPVDARCGDERHVDINCVHEERLEPGQLRLLVSVAGYRGGTVHDRPAIEAGTTTRLSIAGMSAILDEFDPRPDSYYREDQLIHWEIARPGTEGANVVRLEAMLREPGIAQGRAQLDALVASIRFSRLPDPTPLETPAPTDAHAPSVADLREMTVEELIATATRPSAEEVIVRGWLTRANVVVDCNVDPDPHPLVPFCADFGLYLTAEPVLLTRGLEGPGISHVVPMLGPDSHSTGIPSSSTNEVLVVGHRLDHRWSSCREDRQAECRSRFVIDRVVPAGQPLDDGTPSPWAIPGDRSVEGAEQAVEILSGVVGGVSVVSIGNADANGVRSIEPLVEEINNEEGAWVIRALVAGDRAPVARTFLVGHIGHWTVFEVTESRVVDRIAEPIGSWPPDGILEVPMGVESTGLTPRAGVVDRTGLLIEARTAVETDPGRGNVDLQPGEMAVVQAAPDTIVAWWDGTLCDDRLVLTAYGERAGLPPDHLELRGESADSCRSALVHRGIVLRFSGPVDAEAVNGWDRVGTPFETFPPVDATVVALPTPGGFDLPRVRAALVDLSGRITSARLPRADEPRPATTWDGQGVLVPDPSVAGRYQLIWNGGVCTPDIVITIDAALSNVVVSNPVPGNCDTIGNEYRLVLDIDGPLDPPAVEVRYAETSAGAS